MAKASSRTIVVDEGVALAPDGELRLTGVFDLERADELAHNLLRVLAEVGGMVWMVSDRVRVGTAPGGAPLAQSRRLIVEWQAFAPMREDDEQMPAVGLWGDDDDVQRERTAQPTELGDDEEEHVGVEDDPWAAGEPASKEPDRS